MDLGETMSICYWCYWGWPKKIQEIYDKACAEIGESAMDYGPGHVVWADENWHCAAGCAADCDSSEWKDWHPETLAIVKRSLIELDALPDNLKITPADYDGEHPENYPPPAQMEMVKQVHAH